jgi:hypothetical protein
MPKPVYSELVRQQKVLELFGKKVASEGIKWIPVKFNRRVPVGMPPNVYDFEGVKLERRDGKVVLVPTKDYASPVIGSRAEENEPSPHGYIKVAPTEYNIALLEKYASQAGVSKKERSKGGAPEVTEIRITVPRYERLDVEDAALLQELASRMQSPEVLAAYLENAPDSVIDVLGKRLGLK